MHRCSGGDDVALLTFVDFCGFRKQTKQCKCLVATRLAGLAGKGGAGQGSKQKRDASCPIVGFRVLACQVINWLARGGWSPMGGWVCVRNQRQTADSSQPLRLHFSSSTHPHHESRSNPIPHSTFSNQQPAYYRLPPGVLEISFCYPWCKRLCIDCAICGFLCFSCEAILIILESGRLSFPSRNHPTPRDKLGRTRTRFFVRCFERVVWRTVCWKETRHWAV